MCGLVEANLDLCGVPEELTEVVNGEAAEFVRRANARGAQGWDIVFFDPPYAADYLPALEALAAPSAPALAAGGLLVVEHHHKNQLKDALGTLRRWRILKQGDSALSFYERA
jgi:16S rRNA G966 N2-methylase RsmD